MSKWPEYGHFLVEFGAQQAALTRPYSDRDNVVQASFMVSEPKVKKLTPVWLHSGCCGAARTE